MGYQPLGSRYFLEEPIGQGGMGVVWRGRDRVVGDVCAIKVLRPELAADPGAVTRFVRERTALVKFRHPNVVTLRDMIVEGDCLALVMDFIEGGDLGSYRQNCGGTLPAAEALQLTAQICDALAAAHAAGIVHRDLKPANVLLDAGQARLADFGIARVAGESPATTTGMVIGTIGFMSPEVIKGEEPGPACDVYAVGITLYELLTGAQPFTGQAVAVMRSHLDVMPARPDGMPDRMWALLSACLNKEPAARPPAAVVARALRDPVLHSEAALRDQARPRPSGPYGVPPRVPDSMPSGPVPYGRPSGAINPSGAFHPSGAFNPSGAFSAPPRSGPVTASVRLAAMASSAVPPSAGGIETGAPPTDAGWADAAPDTEVGYLGVGPAGQPPSAGHRGNRRRPRRRGVSPLWAAAAAVVLLLVGGGATYLVTSSPAQGKTAEPAASAVAASLGEAAASAGVTSPAASRSASPSSSAHASTA
ncbi:MAG TPA: serine/threonine-protein kinase, partial [Trebonia sp.]|nr:serine/threonine-protein kinase [Trebonia sp.]